MSTIGRPLVPFAAVAVALAFVATPLAGASHYGALQVGHEHVNVFQLTSLRGIQNTPTFYSTNEWGNAIAGISYGYGSGLVGIHEATVGTAPGVLGETYSTAANAAGITGVVTAAGAGIDSAGVRGINNGTSAQRFGVWGSASGSGIGVFGSVPVGTGAAIYGQYAGGATYGILGTGHHGVRGFAQNANTAGVYGASAVGTGVYGTSSHGFAGFFNGKVGLSDKLEVGHDVLLGGRVLSTDIRELAGSVPNVSETGVYRTPASGLPLLTGFSGGAAGQRLTVIFGGTTTVADNDSLRLAGEFAGTVDDTLELIFDGTAWYELSRSVN